MTEQAAPIHGWWVRLRPRAANAQFESEARALELLVGQWNSPEGVCDVVIERSAQEAPDARDQRDVFGRCGGLDVSSVGYLESEWIACQLVAEATQTGELLGARVCLAPQDHHWRVYVLVPLLGAAFPSGKLNESAVGALRAARRRLARRAGSQ